MSATHASAPAHARGGSPAKVSQARLATTARRKFRVSKLVGNLTAIVVALLWVFPVYWMINSSFTPNARLSSRTPSFFPTNATTANYENATDGTGFWSALQMSLLITIVTLIAVILFAFLAALAISRFKFRGRKSFIVAVLFIQMLPAEGLFIAQYKMLSATNLLNSVVGVSILYTAAIVPFTIWMLRGFVAGIPAELEEAAMVDGLSRTKAFLKITFPLLAPGLVAAGVYAFLQAWNEFTIALVALPAADKQTLPLWLRGFLNASVNQGVNWAQVMAASTLIALPVMIFFLFVQNKMTGGLVSGAVKG
ncbi:sugar ABC transporter permease [Paraoerskovia sediminicola]|uniref:Sugar ABC transporter permease n=1 Tax=Paraoerskovia sediminicola TaxID=1138587 RepID=A0ABN6X830_9CELL|nr:carbohydrate ABC transporter permease [Paraoerskovia sediminicola]BDZ40864.1 sugar ABC transporter permease [Paraoerskovia sediminicola]